MDRRFHKSVFSSWILINFNHSDGALGPKIDTRTKNCSHELMKKLESIELFSGAGGLALGLHAAGFRHKALYKWNPAEVETLQLHSVWGCDAIILLNSSSQNYQQTLQ